MSENNETTPPPSPTMIQEVKGIKIITKNLNRINPAQAFTEQHAYFAHRITHLVEKIDPKTGDKIGEEIRDDIYLISSDRKYTRLYYTTSPFQGGDYFITKVPDDVPRRWSAKSIADFLDGKEQKLNPTELFYNIVRIYDQLVDFENTKHGAEINALYTMGTYVYRLFASFPYINLVGERGSGKTKLGEIHNSLDFNAFMSVGITSANIFRTIEDTAGTLILDESEKMEIQEKSEAQFDIEAILNSGYRETGYVSRIEREGRRNVRKQYSTYSPKILIGIRSLTPTLLDRSFVINMYKTLNPDKANKAVPSPNSPEFLEIRDQLYLFAMNFWKDIRAVKDTIKNENDEFGIKLTGREFEKALPMLTLAKFLDQHGAIFAERHVWEFIAEQRQKVASISLDSFDRVLIESLQEFIEKSISDGTFTGTVKLRDFASIVASAEGYDRDRNFNLRSYASRIKKKLMSLGLASDFRNSTDNYTVFVTNLELIKKAKMRFGLMGAEEKGDVVYDSLLTSINSLNAVVNTVNSLSDADKQKLRQKLEDDGKLSEILADLYKDIPRIVKLLHGGERKWN